MLEEQAIIPNFTSYPNPNPNPPPSHTDASHYPHSTSLQDRSAIELAGALTPPPPLNGSIPQATNSTTHDHVGVTMSEATNGVSVPTMQPESILPFHCDVCNISCNTKDVLEKHKLGKKHLKGVKKLAGSSADAPNMALPPDGSEVQLDNKEYMVLQNGGTSEKMMHCDICNVDCNNQEVFEKHVAGKKHSAKAILQQAGANAVFDATSDSSGGPQKLPGTFRCEICKITCNSNELLKVHMTGRKHLKKLKDSGQIPNPPLTPIASQDTPPVAKPVCELCGITCDTNEVLQYHIAGRKHQKKLKDSGKLPNPPLTPIASQDTPPTKLAVNPESNEGKTVSQHEAKPTCELCEISCDTDEVLKFHMTGKKHRKKLEKSENLIGPNPALAAEAEATPMVIGPLQEEVKVVSSGGSKRKGKRGETDEDVETKRQKVLQSGTAADAVQTCEICNVVCNSRKVFISHLGGQKHAAMAVKQAEAAQARATDQES